MFKDVSTDAKVLYGLMLDRMGLSVKNRWFDEENRVYIVYTIMDIMEDLKSIGNPFGTMRRGGYDTIITKGSKAHAAYGSERITERHYHRYELNVEYREELENAGLLCSGVHPESGLVDIVEFPACDWYMGVIYEPQYQSTVLHPSPLIMEFVKNVIARKKD